MKKLIVIFAVLLSSSLSCQSLFAQESISNKNWYARLGVGYAKPIDAYDEVNFGFTEWEFDGGPDFTISIGYIANFWAAEVEASYRSMDAENRILKGGGEVLTLDGDQTQATLMVNGFWIPKQDWLLSPYIGAGLGVTRISWNDVTNPVFSDSLDDSDTVFAYQFIIGVSYTITPALALEMDYKYFAAGDIKITTTLGQTGKLEDQKLNIFGLAVKYRS